MELMVRLYFCCTFAELAALAENPPKPTSARRTPARTITRPIKMRGSRKANCEPDFFFMSGHDVDKIRATGHLLAVRSTFAANPVADGDAAACLLPPCHAAATLPARPALARPAVSGFGPAPC